MPFQYTLGTRPGFSARSAPQETLKRAKIRVSPLPTQALIRKTPICFAGKLADESQKIPSPTPFGFLKS
jgi:hypothetical protein